MEPMTALVLAFQLLALFSIAGALLMYLICKVRNTETRLSGAQAGTVLVTSADTALGLQLCTHLANRGCRVFAGMRQAQDSLPAKLLSGWLKMRECTDDPVPGCIIPLRLDVTREDVMREAVDAMGAHLNAGERGIAAVINTSGSVYRGRIEQQDVQQWEQMLKTNVLGALRVAKAFVALLRPTRGRLIYLGGNGNQERKGDGRELGGDGLVAFNATRVAVERCAEDLRRELQPYGIKVVALDTCGMRAEALFNAPVPQSVTDCEGAPKQYTADVLSANALQMVERALWDVRPQERYQLGVPNNKYNFMLPCRSTMRLNRLQSAHAVQRV